MKVEIEGDGSLAIFYPNDTPVEQWGRTPLEPQKTGFEVEVYVEGYRPNKEVWKHETFTFDTLADALAFAHEVGMKSWDEFQKWIEPNYQDSGWYSISFEYTRVLERTADGTTYVWERIRE